MSENILDKVAGKVAHAHLKTLTGDGVLGVSSGEFLHGLRAVADYKNAELYLKTEAGENGALSVGTFSGRVGEFSERTGLFEQTGFEDISRDGDDVRGVRYQHTMDADGKRVSVSALAGVVASGGVQTEIRVGTGRDFFDNKVSMGIGLATSSGTDHDFVRVDAMASYENKVSETLSLSAKGQIGVTSLGSREDIVAMAAGVTVDKRLSGDNGLSAIANGSFRIDSSSTRASADVGVYKDVSVRGTAIGRVGAYVGGHVDSDQPSGVSIGARMTYPF